jgi:hypothetical protein
MPETPAALDPAGLRPLLDFVGGLDLSRPRDAEAALDAAWPLDGAFVSGLRALMEAGLADGTLCGRGEPPVRFSRVWKAGADGAAQSADAVLMSGPGPRHEHPEGEVDLCFATAGTPTFDGRPPGWVVYPPGSVHVPTVQGGEMLILYLLPGGAIRFLAA